MIAAPGVLVIGVGRSGTSVATQVASTMGLRLPAADDLMPANDDNPDGYFESLSLSAFDDELLRRLGVTWWTPPSVPADALEPTLAAVDERALATFRATFGTETGYLWKDPRLTVLLPFWLRLLGEPLLILPFRHPLEVAHSLVRRDGLTVTEGLAVWERHTRAVLAAAAGHAVVVLAYDDLRRDPAAWNRTVHDFCHAHGLDVRPPPSAPEELVRSPSSSASGWMSVQQRSLHDRLCASVGPHERFASTTLGDETGWVAEVIARMHLPSWFTPG